MPYLCLVGVRVRATCVLMVSNVVQATKVPGTRSAYAKHTMDMTTGSDSRAMIAAMKPGCSSMYEPS